MPDGGGLPLIGGAISGIGSLFGAQTSADAATKAARIQAQSAQQALQLQQQMYEQTRADLGPFRELGYQTGMNLATSLAPGGRLDIGVGVPSAASAPTWNPTMEGLAQTPGYQFALTQGLKAAQNYNTASGLGQSGAAGIAQSKYAEGLASTTYQQQFGNFQSLFGNWQQLFQNALNQKSTLYNMLAGGTQLGEAAGAQTASAGLQSAQAMANDLTSGAAARAGGVVGSANALTAGVTNATSNLGLMAALSGGGMFGGGSGLNALFGGGGTTTAPSASFDPTAASPAILAAGVTQ